MIEEELSFTPLKIAHTLYEDWYNIFTIIYERKRVATINGIKIYIYREDSSKHKAPHLHAYYQDQNVTIDLKTFKVTGNLPASKKKKALAWVKNKKKFLYEHWNELNNGVKLPVI